jgi:hypothetical protein
MCGLNKNYVQLCIVIFTFLLIYTCSKEKSITQPNSDYYISTWPDSVISTGLGAANSKLPLPAQRAGAIRTARLNCMRNLLNLINSLPISESETVFTLSKSTGNDSLEIKINSHVKGVVFQGDPKYFSDGSVEVKGFLLTAPLKEMVKEYLK